ncbi:MAG: hypothetical protein Q9219_000437 [cf. Caloplaca sp. 3 TL-2023]
MADTLCGPSNPLQNFQKHASVDRTLERDRLVSRYVPKEGFRTPNPNAGTLDAEFEAFLAGEPMIDPFQPQHNWQSHHQAPVYSQVSQQRRPDWASDFQNLHVHDTRAAPLPSVRFREEAPLQRSASGSWQKEFSQGIQHQSSNNQQNWQIRSPMGGVMNNGYLSLSNPSHSAAVAEQQPQVQVKNTLDEEAFEKAFDAAHLQFQNQQSHIQHQEPIKEPQPLLSSNTAEDRIDYRIGSDRILDDSQAQSERSDDQEADELARTAGHLLENVKHDQSAKFQESNFLSLMRQLQDKEVKVEGDHIVQVSCAKFLH